MTLSEHLAARHAGAARFDTRLQAGPAADAVRSSWQPWEMRSLPRPQAAATPRGAAAAASERQPAAAPPPDDIELQRLRSEACEAGAAQGRRDGWAQGHAEGYAAGWAAGEAAASAQAGQLRALAAALSDALRRAETETGEALLALALDVARQVVHHSLRVEPGWIVPLVQDLLHREPALQGEPRLLLHPDDAALVNSALATELQTAGWQVRPDEAISRGGCLVQAATGAQDATVETRWARVTAAFGGDAH